MSNDFLRDLTRNTPYQGHLWLVGGVVRDALLKRPAKTDVDIVTTLPIEPLIEILTPHADHFPVVYPRFGTAMVHLKGTQFEFVTARKESYDEESRKPEVEPATLEQDAERRDFTVNALLQNLHTGEYLDPTGHGQEDLKAKILRTPKDPTATFFDDPLRMLRAIRFRWQLGFEPAPNLYPAIAENAHRLAIISAERYRDEFNKILLGPQASEALKEMMDLGLFHHFIAEFEAMRGIDQGNYHHLDVWDHTRLVVANLGDNNDLLLKLSALFHDVGKPPTRIVDKTGKIRFFGHEAVGEKLTREILRRLKFSNDEIDTVAKLVKNHMRLGSSPRFTPTAARRLWRDLGPDVPRLLDLVEADASALKPGVRALNLEPIRTQLDQVHQQTPASKLKSPLSGEEIIRILNLEPGRKVGEAKNYLLEKVLEGLLDPEDKEKAEQMLRGDYARTKASKSRKT